MKYSLTLNDVSKQYKANGFLLDHISFAVPQGSIMGLVGENGAGKTTAIDCILNTLIRDTGTITLLGQEMSDSDTAIRQEIGVVYDGTNFPGYLNAKQLANIMRDLYHNWDDALFKHYLCDFHLTMNQKLKTYSKGMLLKLAVAAALSHHPKLLILDEATSGLDPVIRDEMLDLFLDFVGTEDHSILLSSHITSDLEKAADYITFIHQGRIILTASKDDLIYNYAVMRCKASQFQALVPSDVIAYRKRDYQIDVLIANAKEAKKKYKDIVIDHVSIDEILLMLVKGERL